MLAGRQRGRLVGAEAAAGQGHRMHDRSAAGAAEAAQSSSARWWVGVLLLLLAGCAPAPREPPAATALPALAPASGACLRLDATRSELRILAYRAGPLARLGHNHVLLADGLEGEWCQGRFTLSFPVASLRIDAQAARAEEGEAFASVPTPSDIEGTRRHLLAPDQLDAATWPRIRASGALAPTVGATTVPLQLEVRGARYEIAVPVRVRTDGEGRTVIEGSADIAQSALGIEPYRVALGALQVRDELTVRFRLVSQVPATPPAAGARTSMDPRA